MIYANVQEDQNCIKFTLDEGAMVPTKAHPTDAGFDLYTREAFTLFPEDHHIVDTGVHMSIHGCGLIVSKSGLNTKQHITTTGLIDQDYTGSIKVKLDRHAPDYFPPYRFERGDKVAQIIILPVPEVHLVHVDSLDETERGSGGFGSTGR